MDTNPVDPGIGSIFGGLAIVLGLAVVAFLIGAWVVTQFRRGRVNEETDISYPSVPQSADDRRAVQEVHERERAVGDHTAAPTAGREVPQTPERAERPVDAAHNRGVDPATNADGSPAGEGRPTRNPL